MKLKKMFAGVVAAAMMLTMSATVFAEGSSITVPDGDGTGTTYSDISSVTIEKVYKAANEGTTSPAETFTLVQDGAGTVKDGDAKAAPPLGTITGAAFEAGAATTTGAIGNIIVQLPTYDTVGVYEYTLKETNNGNAGVSYRTEEIKLVVTVMQGNDGKVRVAGVHTESGNEGKSGSFENTYSAADALKVTKTVEGNMGDQDKYFDFTVTLTGESGKAYASSYAVSGGSYEGNPESVEVKPGETTTLNLKLKHGDTVTIDNLPYGVEYTVAEKDYSSEKYTTTKTGETGTINGSEFTAAFTNTKGGTVDTGIGLDSLPYIMILAMVVVATVVFFGKKRFARD